MDEIGSAEPGTPDGEHWLAAQPGRRRSRRGTVLLWATAGIVAAGGGAIAVTAAHAGGGTATPAGQPGAGLPGAGLPGAGLPGGLPGEGPGDSSSTPGGGAVPAPDGSVAPSPGPEPGGPGGGPRLGGPGPAGALHGTFVVARRTGSTTTYVTEQLQTGTVTASSTTSLAVRSSDGFAATYVLGSATRRFGTAAVGATVTVIASGRPATASLVLAGTRGAVDGGPGGWGGRAPGAPSGELPTARPSGAV